MGRETKELMFDRSIQVSQFNCDVHPIVNKTQRTLSQPDDMRGYHVSMDFI
jgi:hypothetical protein